MSTDPMQQGTFPAARGTLPFDCKCGAKFGWPLRLIKVPEFCFHNDCCFHDFLYELGGSPKDRKCADDQLYWDMRQRIRAKRWWQRPTYRAIAWVYYRAVRQFGGKYFRWTSDRPR